MKFVHLTSQPDISRIKKNGLRLGDGRCGRGIYAVPLMMMQRVSLNGDDRIIPSDSHSSAALWQWLSNERGRHRNLAAVVFKTAAVHWPANLYIQIGADIGTAWLNNLTPNCIETATDNLDFVRNANDQGFNADLQLVVNDPHSLGAVFHEIQKAGFKTRDKYDGSIEIVLPSPVDSNLIVNITPLYRTNKQFKQDRQRKIKSD